MIAKVEITKEGFMGFLEAANSATVYIICGLTLLIIIGIILSYLITAIKRAKVIGISTSTIVKTTKTTMLVSIGPALSILVPMIAMMMILGTPWTWLRLSVVGSAPMELMVADMALKYAGTSTGLTDVSILAAEQFGLIAMCVGISVGGGCILVALFNKKYTTGIAKMKSSNGTWTAILLAALFGGFILQAGAEPLLHGGAVQTSVFIFTFVITGVVGITIQKLNIKWLKDYAFALSLLLGMAFAILANMIF